MEHSPLARLPAELRNYIYELALTAPGEVKVQRRRDTGKLHAFCVRRFDEPKLCLLTLATTCKQVQQEATQLFFACNVFEVLAWDTTDVLDETPQRSTSTLHDFLAVIGPVNTNALSKVHFFLGPMWPTDVDFQHNRANVVEIFRILGAWHSAYPKWHLKGSLNLVYLSGGHHQNIVIRKVHIALEEPQTTSRSIAADLRAWADSTTEGRGTDRWQVESHDDFFEHVGKELARSERRSLRRKKGTSTSTAV